MKSNGIHYMALDKAREDIKECTERFKQTNEQLQEAIKEGDLSENASYDMLKADIRKLAEDRERLEDVLTLPQISCPDSEPNIREGSIIHLTIYSVTKNPLDKDSPEWTETFGNRDKWIFDGVVMFGGSLPIHRLVKDKILSSTTAIGECINRRPQGDKSVKVPGGYANLRVEKCPAAGFDASQLYVRLA